MKLSFPAREHQPWTTLGAICRVLAFAQDQLQGDYDGHGWEELQQAASVLASVMDEFDFTPAAVDGGSFADRVDRFVVEAFSPIGARCVEERTHRFLEESIELAQATGCTRDEAHQLVDYVFGRPVGEPWQEAGGVMLTLAALCRAVGLDHEECGERELIRALGKIDVIRQKHLNKPRRSPLPGQTTEAL